MFLDNLISVFELIKHKFITNYKLTNYEVEFASGQSLQGKLQVLQFTRKKG